MKLWNHFKTDSLFRNSGYLMMSTGIMGVLGFAFWIFVARLFSPHDVGIATALISACALLSNLSLLGFNYSIIRYLPMSNNKSERINSVLVLIAIASVITSVIFMTGLKLFSPQLVFLQRNVLYILSFTLFVIGLSFNTVVDSIFVAHRASENVLIKNAVLSVLKVIFPLFFIFIGSYGIFSSVSLATLISSIIGLVILYYRHAYKPSANFSTEIVKEMALFSGGSYVASFFSQASSLILPLIMINLLNAETVAYFYVSTMIMNFLMIIAQATTQSFLAEGSHNLRDLRKHFLKSLIIVFLLLIPTILIIVLFGNIILHAFGKSYAYEAFSFLRIMSIDTVFMSITTLGNSLLRLRHKIKYLVGLNAWNAVFTLAIVYYFIPRGLVAIGWAMLFSQVVLTVIYFFFFWKKKLL